MADTVHVWHDDGHVLNLWLNGAELQITLIQCPFEYTTDFSKADCYHEDIEGCVVSYFLTMYGLDCNVGSCEPMPDMQIAWSLQGNVKHIDEIQCWVISITDDMFASWRATQTQES